MPCCSCKSRYKRLVDAVFPAVGETGDESECAARGRRRERNNGGRKRGKRGGESGTEGEREGFPIGERRTGRHTDTHSGEETRETHREKKRHTRHTQVTHKTHKTHKRTHSRHTPASWFRPAGKLEHLTWYAASEPRKLPKIGRYLAGRTIAAVRKQKDG